MKNQDTGLALSILNLLMFLFLFVSKGTALAASSHFYDCTGKSYCRTEALNFLNTNLISADNIEADSSIGFVSSYTNINFEKTRDKKIGFLFIYTHGLYLNANQFKILAQQNNLQDYSLKTPLDHNLTSYILLTLPGHGKELSSHSETVTYVDWKIYLHNIVLAARQIADNVILVGQSTGGVLSLVEAIDHPKLVDALWLIEPAIKVDPLMQKMACAGKSVFADISPIYKAAKIFGLEHDGSKTPIRYGCEVKNIWLEYLSRKQLISNNFRNTDTGNFFNASQKGIASLKTPLFLEYNPNDNIVDNKILSIFSTVNVPLIKAANEGKMHGSSAFGPSLKRYFDFFALHLKYSRDLSDEKNKRALAEYLVRKIIPYLKNLETNASENEHNKTIEKLRHVMAAMERRSESSYDNCENYLSNLRILFSKFKGNPKVLSKIVKTSETLSALKKKCLKN